MAQSINDSLYVKKNTPLDAKESVFSTMQEFFNTVDVEYRYPGLKFRVVEGVRIVEYWLQGGVLLEHVEPYIPAIVNEDYFSTWINKPVIQIVNDLPGTPSLGDRYIHNSIIKEYKPAGWTDIVGGTGFDLADGMAVMVRNTGEGLNRIYVYSVLSGGWMPYLDGADLDIEDALVSRMRFKSPDLSVFRLSISDLGEIVITKEV